VALIWQFMTVGKIGLLSRLSSMLGFGSKSFLGDPNWALITVVFVTVWFLMGFYMLIFLGGLQAIPREYYDSASMDGANSFQSFWHITFPLLKPTSFFVVLVSLVAAVSGAQVFDLVYVMTSGGPAHSTAILIVYIYKQAFQNGNFGYADAMASVVVLMLLAITSLLFICTRGGRFNYA
jgi:multiple sugar transport system permease protein